MRAGSSRMASDININLYNSLFEDATKRQRTSAPTSELGQYMATNFLITLRPEEFTNFDILAWWKEREIQFPILSAMARDLLTVQASTVASESAFSISGRIISERRSRLTPESVEVCVCLKDYLDGVDRVQHETSLEGPILEDVEETIAREEVDLGISPPNTELDEGEFEDLDIEHVDVPPGGTGVHSLVRKRASKMVVGNTLKQNFALKRQCVCLVDSRSIHYTDRMSRWISLDCLKLEGLLLEIPANRSSLCVSGDSTTANALVDNVGLSSVCDIDLRGPQNVIGSPKCETTSSRGAGQPVGSLCGHSSIMNVDVHDADATTVSSSGDHTSNVVVTCIEDNLLNANSATRTDNPFALSGHAGFPHGYMYLGTCDQIYQHCGQLYHWISSLCPAKGEPPRFLQLYIYNTGNEIDNRMRHFDGENIDLCRDIIEGLIELLDAHNALVQLFTTAREKLEDAQIPDFKVRLFNVVGAREYELPTCDMLGAVVYEVGPETETDYDIVIEERSGQPQRVNKLHPSYMSL
ncbi:DNA helicase [Tanacetum coccineum]